jgi:putative ABC transport system substrate-binding protein
MASTGQVMNNRRKLIIALGAGALTVPLGSLAQQRSTKSYRIGWLSPTSPLSGKAELDALREGLRGLGYVEGRNLTIETRWADGNAAALPALARSLVDLKVDIICAAGTQASLVAKQATTTMPIVFGSAAFPDQTGLVASLARPGGNVTGVAFMGPEYGKRLELLREVSPSLARVALLYNDSNPASILALKETQLWANRLGVALEPHGVHSQEDFEKVFAAIARNRPGALMTTADLLIRSRRKEIAEFVAEHRLLSVYPDGDFVEAGGLLSYGMSTLDMYRQAAVYIDRILKGARPADLAVEQPIKFKMTINLKAAKELGITIPQSLLVRADEVIQ